LDDWLLAEQEIGRLIKHQSRVAPGTES
jgi:hypothetical protein